MGVVAEGPSETALIEALIDEAFPGSEVRRIQPDITLASHLGAGWKGVRAWCRENAASLDLVMAGVVGDELDLLVIHADCSMAHNVGARRDCPPVSATADALQTVIKAEWLGLDILPEFVVLMTPGQTTDTWFLLGTGNSWPAQSESLECSLKVEAELARLRIYRWKNGRVKKSGRVLEEVAAATASRWDEVRAACNEADRFWAELSKKQSMMTDAG